MRMPTLPHLRARGFTLIELMVVIAIVAILAAVAMPSYKDYVLRGRIPEGISLLSTKQVQMEQYFLDNHTYTGAGACATDNTPKYFNITCTLSGGGTAYTLTATGKGPMVNFQYTITNAGTKATPSLPSGWTTSSSCWVLRKDGSC